MSFAPMLRSERAQRLDLERDPALRIRRIVTADAAAALREGWRDFLAKPSHNLFLALIYPAAGAGLVWLASGGAALVLLWPLVSGFALIGPVAAIGLFELSRRRERGEPARWTDVAAPFRRPSRGATIRISLTLFALFLLWLLAAREIAGATIGDAPADLSTLVAQAFGTATGRGLLILGNAAGFVFACLALAIGAFSLPLAIDGERSARRAMSASALAVVANYRVMALWGAIVGLGLLAGTLLGLVGLAVALPVFAHATWRLYRRAFEPPEGR